MGKSDINTGVDTSLITILNARLGKKIEVVGLSEYKIHNTVARQFWILTRFPLNTIYSA